MSNASFFVTIDDARFVGGTGGGSNGSGAGGGSSAIIVGGGNAIIVADEGSVITPAATSLNFVGKGVASTNVGTAVTVEISGAASSIGTAFSTTPTEGDFRYDVASHTPQFFNGSGWINLMNTGGIFAIAKTLALNGSVPGVSVGTANLLAGPYTATPPSLSLNTSVPGVSVGTANLLAGPYTATPPSLSLGTSVPGVSVTATSP